MPLTANVSLVHGSVVHLFCERLLKKPRLEGPLSMGGPESQEGRNYEVQGAADQPRRGPESEQPPAVPRRAARRRWYHYIRRRWSKRKAQDTRAPPPTDGWMQKPSQIRGHSHPCPGPYRSPFCVSQEPQGPIRNFLTFGYSTQMNQQRSESGFRRPLRQEPSAGFSQPMQLPPALLDQDYRRALPHYPARPWQQQAPLAGAQAPLHRSCLRQNPVQMQQPNYALQGWRGPSGTM